ncbi:acyltransferase family protein [Subtercola frigoramans]|uniref:Peptidoglycan/LPS O-acetylase OafA/YrhL n=1 Tax=Subtercola frigoramans TaxID=120298 RepID=A0ABS2L903_9MICO|nr:acyltransferase family protein [Subtercola frigoramans]MBM7473578.1 peptidoglycan/LPS O-acetylase OafA/YrhL [Subtercola frigoramans]
MKTSSRHGRSGVGTALGTPGTTSAPSHFMPHIQGLRAIAVLLVVIYHFEPGRLTGGYIGVDVFFVISGFLITQQLSRELERTDRIRLPNFWAKRVRRLLPASLLVLVFSAIALLVVMPLSALTENVREIIASTFYVENWALAANSVDYLAASNDASLVQHYWSLSLEEQFYLVWPILLLGASAFGVNRLRKSRTGAPASSAPGTSPGLGSALGARFAANGRWNAMITLVAAASILSFVLSVVYTKNDPASAYFVTYTRVWEFGVGALLALLPRLRPTRGWLSNALGYAGIVALLYAGFTFDRNTPFPGYAALLPVLGTAAIIVAHRSTRWYDSGRVLSMRVPRFIGDISYSLYLWHWPLIVIAPFVPGWGLSIYNRVALFALAFVLAWLTKKFVEDPARRWQFWASPARRPRRTFGMMVAGMGVMTLVIGGVWAVQQPKYDAAASELAATVASPPECFGAASGPGAVVSGFGASAAVAAAAADGTVIIDSAAGLPETSQLPAPAPTTPGCVNPALADTIIPSPGFGNADRPSHPECLVTLNDSALFACHFGSSDPAAKRVALIGDSHAFALLQPFIQLANDNGWALTTYIKGGCPWSTDPLPGNDAFSASCATWRAHLSTELAAVQPFDVVFTAALADATSPGGSRDGTALAIGFSGAWAEVTAKGTPVVTMVDNPVWADDPNKCLRTTTPAAASVDCVEPRADALVADPPVAMAVASSAAAGDKVMLLDFSSTFCSATDCFAVIGGANVYRDQDHLTNTFATTLAPYLKSALTAAMGVEPGSGSK